MTEQGLKAAPEQDADESRGPGQPPYVPTAQNRKVVEAMSATGLTQLQIASALGISDKTLRKFYRFELDVAAIKANAAVGQSLFLQAVGGPTRDWEKANTTAGIWWSKARMGWKEQPLEVTTPDGKPFQVEDASARDIIIGRIAGIADRLRAGHGAGGSDGGAVIVPSVGLAVLGPPGAEDASGVGEGGAEPGPVDNVASAGGPRIREDEDGVGDDQGSGVRVDPADGNGL